MECSRRDLVLLIPALLAPRSLFSSEEGVLGPKAYRYEDLPVHTDGQVSRRPFLAGRTHTGSRIEIHEVDLAPGGMPHPPHHHEIEEAYLVRGGTLDITLAGETTRLGPGSAAYIASNVEHGIKNVGTTHAQYFVVVLGGGKT
jgi:mannose-6-phosphate isomerase-like protein (cupin superfamily)